MTSPEDRRAELLEQATILKALHKEAQALARQLDVDSRRAFRRVRRYDERKTDNALLTGSN